MFNLLYDYFIEYIYLILYSLLVLRLSLHDIWCWILLNFVILCNDHISFRVAWRSRTFRILTFTFPLFRIFFFFILLRLIVVIQTSILNLLWINFRHNELLKLFLWISLLILIHSEILILHEIVDLNIGRQVLIKNIDLLFFIWPILQTV